MQLLWVMDVRLVVMRWPVILERILVGKRVLVRIHTSSEALKSAAKGRM